PFLSTDSPEALESVVCSGGVLGKNLDGYAHLLHFDRKNGSQLLQDGLCLFLGALVRIDRETDLSHGLFYSQRWMRRPRSGVDGVAGDYRNDLSSLVLYELSALLGRELEFAAFHYLLGDFLWVD